MRKHRGLKARIHNGPKISRTTAHTSTYQRHGGQEYKMGRKLLGLRPIHPHIYVAIYIHIHTHIKRKGISTNTKIKQPLYRSIKQPLHYNQELYR